MVALDVLERTKALGMKSVSESLAVDCVRQFRDLDCSFETDATAHNQWVPKNLSPTNLTKESHKKKRVKQPRAVANVKPNEPCI